ncbi:MAG: 2-oxoacid:ferredoxin oxidoreductase subunit beta, partial [Actinomycetota bacterium]
MTNGNGNGQGVHVQLTKKDYESDQDVRWCPGCGDYAILATVQSYVPELNLPRENIVFISGIGCAARFPYYMETYGFHSIHGRAPALATGVAVARPDLEIWVVTGDGDALSIGGNHLIHAMRRNVNLTVLMFNNQIYGLTKGQYSPTSEPGKVTKSTPAGSVDYPFDPIAIALGAESSFVARSIDVEAKHLQDILRRAHEHKGSTFIEILQNCNVFNDGAWSDLTEKATKADFQLVLEHGKPLVFGKNRDKGIRLNPRLEPEVVKL